MWLFLVCWGVFPRLLRRLIFSFRHLVHLVVLGARWLFPRSNMQSACSFNIRHAICSHHVLGHFLFLFVHCFICLLSLSAAVSGSSRLVLFDFSLPLFLCMQRVTLFLFSNTWFLFVGWPGCLLYLLRKFALSFWLTFFLSLGSSGCLQSVPWLFSQFVCNPLVLSISDGCSHCVNSHFRVFFVCRFICLSLSPVLSDFPFYLRGFLLFFLFIFLSFFHLCIVFVGCCLLLVVLSICSVTLFLFSYAWLLFVCSFCLLVHLAVLYICCIILFFTLFSRSSLIDVLSVAEIIWFFAMSVGCVFDLIFNLYVLSMSGDSYVLSHFRFLLVY